MQASTFQIAWRNLGRSRKRTALAILAIAVGQWALLATQGLMRGYGDNVQRAITGPMVGHIQVHHADYRDEQALDLVIPRVSEKVNRIQALVGVENACARIYSPVLMAPEQEAFSAVVVGADIAAESRDFGLLSGNQLVLSPGHVMVGYRLARKSGIEEGDEIALVGQAADGSLANDLYIVQVIIDGPVDMVNQAGVVMGIEDARRFLAMSDDAHEIVIRMGILESVEPMLHQLRADPALAGFEIVPWREVVPDLAMIIDMVDYVGWFVLILVLIAAVAGIINTLMMATYERMREFGMLLALGCGPKRIVHMILMEAVLLGFLGAFAGSVLAFGFVGATQESGIDMASWGGEEADEFAYGGMRLPLQIVPRIEVIDPLVGLVAVMVFSLLAATWPATVAGHLDPMEAMRT